MRTKHRVMSWKVVTTLQLIGGTVTHQEPVLPKSDEELYLAYVLFGSYASVAREYGCHESSVRKRIKKYVEEHCELRQGPTV